MSASYFSVFKEQNDQNKWNKQKEFASILEGIEETARKEFISALDFLENEFGKLFLTYCNSVLLINKSCECLF